CLVTFQSRSLSTVSCLDRSSERSEKACRLCDSIARLSPRRFWHESRPLLPTIPESSSSTSAGRGSTIQVSWRQAPTAARSPEPSGLGYERASDQARAARELASAGPVGGDQRFRRRCCRG